MKILTISLLALGLVVSAASASVLLYSSPSGGTRSDNGYTFGLRFTVGAAPMVVNSLGLFDQGANGLLAAHDVGLWNDSGVLLASATVPLGTAGTLVDTYRFTSLPSAVTLSAGTSYRLGFLQAASEILYEQGGSASYSFSVTGNPMPYYASGTGLAFPNTAGGNITGFLGPNLLFDPAAAPAQGQLLSAKVIAASSYNTDMGARRKEKMSGDCLELNGPLPATVFGPFPTQQTANSEHFWWTLSGDSERSATWDFGSTQNIASVYIWNFNYTGYTTGGTHTFDVYASDNNVGYTFVTSLTLNIATGAANDPGQLLTFASAFSARYVKFMNLTSFAGGSSPVGFDEAAFYAAIPEPATLGLLLLGVLGLAGRRVR